MMPDVYQIVFLALFFVPAVLFLLTQQRTIRLIQPHNRRIEPGEVFLQLVPLFGMIWQFFVVTRLSDSIRKELGETSFSFEKVPEEYKEKEDRPTYRIGIAYCVLFCGYILPVIGSYLFLAGMVCWIVYWIRLSGYKRKLEEKHHSFSSPPSRP
ncbi:MAG TPA: hypothetical protein VGE66_08615 [Chitinophagaceae bacterium]